MLCHCKRKSPGVSLAVGRAGRSRRVAYGPSGELAEQLRPDSGFGEQWGVCPGLHVLNMFYVCHSKLLTVLSTEYIVGEVLSVSEN